MPATDSFFFGNSLIILLAVGLDLALGDPCWFPHPVRGIGLLIERGEALLRPIARTPRTEKTAGIALAVAVAVIVFALSRVLIDQFFRISYAAGFLASAIVAYTTLAARDLAAHARSVLARLDAGDLAEARVELSLIVGRDTAGLDEQEAARAVIETVAENSSDGIIAPLFFMVLGGPALAMAYKAINTMDSMLGYKNRRYLHFGWAAARLDDLANYVPARVTGLLICLASNLLRRFNSGWSPEPDPSAQSAIQSPWRIMVRDGRNHPSPNSGFPEAAMAGALGVRLGGPSTYGGKAGTKPFLCAEGRAADKNSVEKSIVIMYSATLLAVGTACLSAPAIKWLFHRFFA